MLNSVAGGGLRGQYKGGGLSQKETSKFQRNANPSGPAWGQMNVPMGGLMGPDFLQQLMQQLFGGNKPGNMPNFPQPDPNRIHTMGGGSGPISMGVQSIKDLMGGNTGIAGGLFAKYPNMSIGPQQPQAPSGPPTMPSNLKQGMMGQQGIATKPPNEMSVRGPVWPWM